MSKTPSPDEMRLAADWLEQNEGEGTERTDCRTVAAWLYQQADKADVRHLARINGIPTAKLRARLAACRSVPEKA